MHQVEEIRKFEDEKIENFVDKYKYIFKWSKKKSPWFLTKTIGRQKC